VGMTMRAERIPEVCYLPCMSHKPTFLVAYHDVRASNLDLVQNELALLEPCRGGPVALGVVPEATEAELPRFRAALEAWRAAGYECLLHGVHHRADSQYARTCFGRVELALTGNEAEFAGLSEKNSQTLLVEALRAWERLDVGAADGFIPPTWFAPEHLAEQVLAMGFPCYESRWGIWRMQGGALRNISSIPCSLAGLPEPLPGMILGCSLFLLRFSSLPRLVLHPGELSGSRGKDILAQLRRWQARGVWSGYRTSEKILDLGHD